MRQKSDPKLKAQRPASPDATMAFPVREPSIETGYFPNASPKLLAVLKEELSQYQMKVDTVGVQSYENFVNNIQRVGKITLGNMKMFVAKTRSQRFLIYTCPPEALYELSPAMMSVDLKKRLILGSPKGKTLFVSSLTKEDYNALISICSNLSVNGVKESLAPDINHSLPSTQEFVKKLKKARDIETPLLIFDMDTFADGIKWNIVMSDESNLAYHELTVGEEENIYRLYVNCSPAVQMECVASFRFNGERCLLFEEK